VRLGAAGLPEHLDRLDRAQALAGEAIPADLGNSIGRGRTSTSERAVMSSALCPASTSNAATRVPK